jgi:hypothetical protein
VPKWKAVVPETKALYIVAACFGHYHALMKSLSPVRLDRRKTGVNTADFGRFPKRIF